MTNTGDATIINDRYEIHKRIGRGGMADVFSARDLLLDRQVAIKVLFPEFAVDENFVERFRREAQSAANLSHPNIVNVYDWGKYEGTYFIAMEEVQGRTLADILKTNKQLTSKQAAEVASEVAAALGFAHEKGVAHRDIKPANILIGTNGQVKVADFGIARAMNAAAESNLTQVGSVMGTASYFSPEQAQGAQPDPRSDLYSLGIVMYEMVAGRPPFVGDNPVAIAYKQVHDAPQPLVQIVADVPKAYEAIVAKLLAKDPKLRYPSAGALRDDLRRFRNDEPVQALVSAAQVRSNGDRVAADALGAAEAAALAAGATRANAATTVGAAVPNGRGPARASEVPSQGMYEAGYPTGASTEAAYYDAGGSRTGWYAIGAFLALVALVVGGVLLYRSIADSPSAVGSAEGAELADYQHQDLEAVVAELTRLGYLPRAEAEENAEFASRQVIRTDPPAGTLVLPGREIIVYYNPSAQLVEVPKVVGTSLDQARAALARVGLTVAEPVTTRELEPGDNRAPNTVLEISPPVGEFVEEGSEVTLVVAAPSQTVAIPTVVGLTEGDARALLEDARYAFVVTVQYLESDTVPAGEVMSVDPPQGTFHAAGGAVTLVVSGGPAPVVVPPVKGLTEGQARNQLSAAGLNVAVERVDVPPGSPEDGRVISMSPEGGSKVDRNSTVTITVGRSLVAATTIPPTAPPTTAAPTTAPPSSAAPTTAPPSTAAPTTAAPSTSTGP